MLWFHHFLAIFFFFWNCGSVEVNDSGSLQIEVKLKCGYIWLETSEVHADFEEFQLKLFIEYL